MSLKLRSLPDPTGLLRDDSWGKEDGCHWEYKLRDSQGYLAQIGFCCFFFLTICCYLRPRVLFKHVLDSL